MRALLMWLFFVLLGAVVLDVSRDDMRTTDADRTEQVRALS